MVAESLCLSVGRGRFGSKQCSTPRRHFFNHNRAECASMQSVCVLFLIWHLRPGMPRLATGLRAVASNEARCRCSKQNFRTRKSVRGHMLKIHGTVAFGVVRRSGVSPAGEARVNIQHNTNTQGNEKIQRENFALTTNSPQFQPKQVQPAISCRERLFKHQKRSSTDQTSTSAHSYQEDRSPRTGRVEIISTAAEASGTRLSLWGAGDLQSSARLEILWLL